MSERGERCVRVDECQSTCAFRIRQWRMTVNEAAQFQTRLTGHVSGRSRVQALLTARLECTELRFAWTAGVDGGEGA
jgi:hypothetical protein